MARRTNKQINQSIALIRWLWWQVVRRSPKYQRQVSAQVRLWRRELAKPFLNQPNLERWIALKKALEAYAALKSMGPGVQESEVLGVLQQAMNYRYTVVYGEKEPLIVGGRKLPFKDQRAMGQVDLLQLEEFTRTWGLGFPLPLNMDAPPEHLLTGLTCPVQIEERKPYWQRSAPDDRPHVTGGALVLRIHPKLGREIILALIRGALWHASEKRKLPGSDQLIIVSRKRGTRQDVRIAPGAGESLKIEISLPADKNKVLRTVARHLARSRTRILSREDYEGVFRAVDLRKQGLTRKETARVLWPGFQKTAQSVLDLENTFQKLAATFGIPL